MRSRENRVLKNVKLEVGVGLDPNEVVLGYYDYLTDAFGATAANDGLYTPAEIEHATKVLGRLIQLGAN